MRRLMFAEFSAVALLCVLAGLGFERIFAGSGLAAGLIGAAVIPTGIAIVGMYRNASAASTLLWSVVAFAIYATYTALSDTAPNLLPTIDTLRELTGGLTSGWADLLTVSLPAQLVPRFEVAVLSLIWVAAAVGGEFAHRSRSAVAPVVPALGVYLTSLAFAASQPHGSMILPLSLAATMLVVLLLHTNRWAVLEPSGLRLGTDAEEASDVPMRNRRLSVDTSANRWILLGLPIIAVSILVAGLVAVKLPEREHRFDPRSLREQRIVELAAANPLDGLKAELAIDPANPAPRFSLETNNEAAADAVPRLRLAVLDRFDGASWSSSGQFAKSGRTLPDAAPPSVPTTEVVQRITIEALEQGPWLPAADRPVAITFDDPDVDIAVDPETGVLISGTGSATALTYEVTSEVPQLDVALLRQLSSEPHKDDYSALTNVPNMPAELRDIARNLARSGDDTSTPYDELEAMRTTLSENYRYDESVASGNSYGRLTQFLTEDGAGYAEQFAAAFATLARSLGYPSRLVYGYLTEDTDSAGNSRNLTKITSRQAHVWPEVLLSESLWVPFDPTPTRVPGGPRVAPRTVDNPQSVGGVVAPAATDGTGNTAGATFTEQSDRSVWLSTPMLALFTVLATFILLLAALVIFKRLRRRKRRNGASTTDQVLGAWAEVTDRLLEVGVPLDRSMTAKEVLTVSSTRLSAQATDRLNTMVPYVTLALYSPVEPSIDGASEMWVHANAFHQEVLEGSKWYRGTVALLNPRPVLVNAARR